ncbi:MAG: T9SS type A sorting domain-containing protein [Saprospiraceae bacterium]|nr:T9SS type A sorting domain-containing protein [Lewinella sp.]
MKKRFNTILSLLFVLGVVGMQAQVRYLDQVFTSVSVETNVPYANAISVLTGSAAAQSLTMDVYTPVGDDATDRPVVIYLHTGSFLPQYINGQVTGGKRDSAAVEICTRLAKMGYVAISATYRAGWNPTATGPTGQNTRTGTLLNAAYRGIQDFRSCVRYLRKTIAEEENPYGIASDKIVAWGQGTGGYISAGAAFLDDFEEVNLDKFIDTETLLPYVDTNLVGNPYGTTEKPLCIPNWPTYSSDFQLAVNMGGALGDASWIDGTSATSSEAALVGFHLATDPFAPFGNGPVIVPTTGDFVVNVSGSRTAVDTANVEGVNDVLAPINQLVNFLNLKVQALKPVAFQFPGQEVTTLATENMYPFLEGASIGQPRSGLWDWYGVAQMTAEVNVLNQFLPEPIDPNTLNSNTLITNPDMSKEKALVYIDTVMMYYAPRGCAALGLTECLDALGVVGVDEIVDAKLVELQLGPNPARSEVQFRSGFEHPMKEIRVFDLKGLMVQSHLKINAHQFTMERGNLPPGIYLARVRFEEGILTKKIVFN